MKLIARKLTLGFLLMGIWNALACSSTPKIHSSEPDNEPQSNADLEAFAAYEFTFPKNQPTHDSDQVWEFYYKHCDLNGERSYYSKTSYACTDPFH